MNKIFPFNIRKRTYPVMNLYIGIKDSDKSIKSSFCEEDTIDTILRKINKIKSFLGNVILYSDGKIKKGFNKYLIIKEGCFNVSINNIDAFYWEDGNNPFNYEHFFIKDNELYLGDLLIEDLSYEKSNSYKAIVVTKKPIYNLYGLYRKNKIPNKNTKRKIEFLENLLNKKDKSGYMPKDMLTKNKELRLRLLEQNYRNNAMYYAGIGPRDNIIKFT
jgi:hypothetical protein